MNGLNKRDNAKNDYLIGKSYKDIAEKYSVSPATVRAWKSRYRWPDKPRNSKRNSDSATQQDNATNSQHVATDVFVTDETLTEKQKLFCVYYLQSFNATQSYLKAYGGKYGTANVKGSQMLAKDSVKNYLNKIKQHTMDNVLVDLQDLVRRDIKQAFGSNVTDVVNWETSEIFETDENDEPIFDKNGKAVKRHFTDIYLNDMDEVDKSQIKKISKGRDGLVVEMRDPEKAMDRLYKYFNVSDDGNNATININIGKKKKED